MIKGIHFLLTYQCNLQCDHCFLYSGPKAKGVFSVAKIKEALNDSKNIPTMDHVFFEGGEPFIYYETMLKGIRYARELDLDVGIVTNGYWARDRKRAMAVLKPLKALGVSSIGLSDDAFHYGKRKDTPPKIAHEVCEALGIANSYICIEPPSVNTVSDESHRGEPIVGGGTVFKGRAVDNLSDGLPFQDWKTFNSCPREELKTPSRVHLDPFGNIFICQGISIGNTNQKPLSEIINEYQPEKHPILGPLYQGGPALLAESYNCDTKGKYVEPCHLCFSARRELMTRFSDHLTPAQVYGVA